VTRVLSCGVLVTDGHHLLIGHATASSRWDIPKGQADAGELPEAAARRELLEETGLSAEGASLVALGQHPYLAAKDLALYAWLVGSMPDPASLACTSFFLLRGRSVPEFDGFACPLWIDAMPRLGRAMQAVLQGVAVQRGWL